MNRMPAQQIRVLAIDPFTRGFGFVILEGPEHLVDWGMKEVRKNKAARSLKQLADLIEHYQPDVIVAEDCMDKHCRRSSRVRELIQEILELAVNKKVKTDSVAKHTVKVACLKSGARTKDEIASVIAKRFPELALRRPPVRQSWMSEAERMSIFDAAAFALTFFTRRDCPDAGSKEEGEVMGNYAAWGGVIEDSVRMIRCARSARGRL